MRSACSRSGGSRGTPVPLVAEVAGVGAGTLYRYFDSKEALVNALYQRCRSKAAMGEAILTAFPVDAPPRKQFHELWSRLSAFARENATALAFLELHHHGPYLDEKSRAMDEVMLGPARAFVERAQAQGEVKPYLPGPAHRRRLRLLRRRGEGLSRARDGGSLPRCWTPPSSAPGTRSGAYGPARFRRPAPCEGGFFSAPESE
ncbi:MAG: TetR/AcrR family transcriptional regulator [Dermatophilaceae bacterium]